MIKNTYKKIKRMFEASREKVALICEAILAGVSVAGFIYKGNISSILSFGLIFVLICLFAVRMWFTTRNKHIEQDYRKERKLNEINESVFNSLYKLNSEKVREVFRHTYGNVPDWNPIDYGENVLVYDIHEHIRSILVSLVQVVIDINPQRFSDRNVSVELVYCYPVDDKEAAVLPYSKMTSQEITGDPKQEKNKGKTAGHDERVLESKENSKRQPWKLISSGNVSGDHESVLKHLSEKDSLYTLLECCGTLFRNDKSKSVKEFRKKLVQKRLVSKYGEHGADGIVDSFFRFDIRDWERSVDGDCKGSAIGTVINIRNDNPEDVFVKAILTINTFGECIFKGKDRKRIDDEYVEVDEFGLTCDNYETVFIETILSTYSKLLEAELAQMYIRHSIREGTRCRRTGRLMKKIQRPVSECSACIIKECCSNKRKNHHCQGNCVDDGGETV